MELANKVADASPEDRNIRVLKVEIQIAARALRLHGAPSLGINLRRHMSLEFAPLAPFQIHNAAEQHTKIPIVELEAQKEQGSIDQCAEHGCWNEIVVLGYADQIVEIIVLGQY